MTFIFMYLLIVKSKINEKNLEKNLNILIYIFNNLSTINSLITENKRNY